MYLAVVILTMAVLPVLSILIELVTGPTADTVTLVGKWFVFWAVGARLFTAGLNQILRPGFTAQGIFGQPNAGADRLVVEIGFSNVAIGLTALASLLLPGWRVPAAFAGMIFLGLAGIQHIWNRNRSRNETIALVSDLAVTAVLLAWLLLSELGG